MATLETMNGKGLTSQSGILPVVFLVLLLAGGSQAKAGLVFDVSGAYYSVVDDDSGHPGPELRIEIPFRNNSTAGDANNLIRANLVSTNGPMGIYRLGFMDWMDGWGANYSPTSSVVEFIGNGGYIPPEGELGRVVLFSHYTNRVPGYATAMSAGYEPFPQTPLVWVPMAPAVLPWLMLSSTNAPFFDLTASGLASGRTYAVETSSNVFQNVWTGATFTATSGVQTIGVTGETQRTFFRLATPP